MQNKQSIYITKHLNIIIFLLLKFVTFKYNTRNVAYEPISILYCFISLSYSAYTFVKKVGSRTNAVPCSILPMYLYVMEVGICKINGSAKDVDCKQCFVRFFSNIFFDK